MSEYEANDPYIPMSLRTAAGELAYADARRENTLYPLADMPAIKDWKHWKLIANRFPYDIAFRVHHMLIPKREVGTFLELNQEEILEFYEIVTDFVEVNYDLWFVNCARKRSILTHYHVHLAAYHGDRKDMKL